MLLLHRGLIVNAVCDTRIQLSMCYLDISILCVTCICRVCVAAYVSLCECSLCPVHVCPASLEQILMLTLIGDAEAT